MRRKTRHYTKPAKTSSKVINTILDVLERVVVCPSGCWLWAGADSGNHPKSGNYGKVLPPGARTPEAAHRFIYRKFVGKIPKGHDVDHKCRHWHGEQWAWITRRCVNPDHLEAVKPVINQDRRRLDFVMARIRAEYGEELDMAVEELSTSHTQPFVCEQIGA